MSPVKILAGVIVLIGAALYFGWPLASTSGIAAGTPKLGQPMVGIPAKGASFVMQMDDADTIGSVYVCMDRVHNLGGGVCEIAKGSIKGGRTMTLSRKYPDVGLALRP